MVLEVNCYLGHVKKCNVKSLRMRVEYSICLWMQIFRQNLRTDADAIFEHPHLSSVHLHCNALHYCPTIDGYKRCADSRIFSPHPIQHLASVIVSPSPRILNLHLPKNFQMCVPSAQESVSALLSDGYVTIHWLSLSEVTAIHCVSFQISSQLTGKADRWQDRQHRDRW